LSTSGRVADGDAAPLRRREVELVEADAEARDDPQARQCAQQRLVGADGRGGDETREGCALRRQERVRVGLVEQAVHVEGGRQARFQRGHQPQCLEHARTGRG